MRWQCISAASTSQVQAQRKATIMDIDAIEDAFIRGDWDNVMQLSREKILERVGASERRNDWTSQAEEALVSMYLQSIFELTKQDEVETAEMVMRSLAPLPFHITLQWIKFLVAMNNNSIALDLLNESLQQCAMELSTSVDPIACRTRYVQLTELLVFHVLAPNESPKVVRDYIANDTVLDDPTKERILDAAHASLAPPQTDPGSVQSPQIGHVGSASKSSSHQNATTRANNIHEQDPAGDLVAIGGTALAVAAVAIGVYRYRDTLREAVGEMGSAISKGLADAKYALFES